MKKRRTRRAAGTKAAADKAAADKETKPSAAEVPAAEKSVARIDRQLIEHARPVNSRPTDASPVVVSPVVRVSELAGAAVATEALVGADTLPVNGAAVPDLVNGALVAETSPINGAASAFMPETETEAATEPEIEAATEAATETETEAATEEPIPEPTAENLERLRAWIEEVEGKAPPIYLNQTEAINGFAAEVAPNQTEEACAPKPEDEAQTAASIADNQTDNQTESQADNQTEAINGFRAEVEGIRPAAAEAHNETETAAADFVQFETAADLLKPEVFYGELKYKEGGKTLVTNHIFKTFAQEWTAVYDLLLRTVAPQQIHDGVSQFLSYHDGKTWENGSALWMHVYTFVKRRQEFATMQQEPAKPFLDNEEEREAKLEAAYLNNGQITEAEIVEAYLPKKDPNPPRKTRAQIIQDIISESGENPF